MKTVARPRTPAKKQATVKIAMVRSMAAVLDNMLASLLALEQARQVPDGPDLAAVKRLRTRCLEILRQAGHRRSLSAGARALERALDRVEVTRQDGEDTEITRTMPALTDAEVLADLKRRAA